MSRLALAAVLFVAVPAAAQGAPPDDLAPTRGQRTVIGVLSLAGGVAVPVLLASSDLFGSGGTDVWGSTGRHAAFVATAPLGMAAGTIAGAELLGLRAPGIPEALSDAVLGFAIGGGTAVVVAAAVGGGLYLAFGRQEFDVVSPMIGGAVGLGVGLPIVVSRATQSVEAAPAAFRAPTGETGTGLSLRVGL